MRREVNASVWKNCTDKHLEQRGPPKPPKIKFRGVVQISRKCYPLSSRERCAVMYHLRVVNIRGNPVPVARVLLPALPARCSARGCATRPSQNGRFSGAPFPAHNLRSPA